MKNDFLRFGDFVGGLEDGAVKAVFELMCRWRHWPRISQEAQIFCYSRGPNRPRKSNPWRKMISCVLKISFEDLGVPWRRDSNRFCNNENAPDATVIGVVYARRRELHFYKKQRSAVTLYLSLIRPHHQASTSKSRVLILCRRTWWNKQTCSRQGVENPTPTYRRWPTREDNYTDGDIKFPIHAKGRSRRTAWVPSVVGVWSAGSLMEHQYGSIWTLFHGR